MRDLPADAKSFLLGVVAAGDEGTGGHLEHVEKVVVAVDVVHTVPSRLEQPAPGLGVIAKRPTVGTRGHTGTRRR